MTSATPIHRALISVSDKSQLIELAKQLIKLNIEILASDGTAKYLSKKNIRVKKYQPIPATQKY